MEILSNINDPLVPPLSMLPVLLGMALAAIVIRNEWWKNPPPLRLGQGVFLGLLAAGTVWLTLTFALLVSKTSQWGGSDGYFTRAVNIALHGVFGEGETSSAVFPPGYSFLLLPVVEAIGTTRWSFFIVNISLLLASAVLFRRFLCRLNVQEGMANALALILFLYPNRLLSTLLPLSDVPFSLVWGAAFACLVLSLWEERPMPYLAATGALAGAASLIRSNGLPLLIALGLGVCLVPQNWKKRVAGLSLFIAAALVVIGPWIVRNYAHFGKVAISYNAGINLSIGNNPTNPVTWNPYVESVWQGPEAWAKVGGRAWNEAQRDSFLAAMGIQYIAAHPRQFLLAGSQRVGRTFRQDSYNFGMLETYTNARVITFQVLTHPDATPLTSRLAHFLHRAFYHLLILLNNTLYYATLTLALYVLIFHRGLPASIRWSFILSALFVCAMIFATIGLSRYKEPLNTAMLVLLASSIAPRRTRKAQESLTRLA